MAETQTTNTRSALTLWGGIAAIVGFVLWMVGAAGAPLVAAFGFVLFAVGLVTLITGKVRDRKRR